MKLPIRRNIDEVAKICGLADELIHYYIDQEWIRPIDIEFKMLDEEDVYRIIFIQDLKEKFGVNEEAIPIILYLVDQLNLIIHNTKRSHS